MQSLKALVIIMGLLIVAGLGLVVYGFAARAPDAVGGAAGFGEVDLPLPAGCVIAASETAEGRLILRLDGPPEAGCQQVVVLDLDSGEVLGRVTARPGP